jgi:serine/threonine protein kinase/Flp pilus assembly protein TadD
VAITPGKRTCAVCGMVLPEDATYCPVCALHGALQTQAYSASDTSSQLRFEHYTVLEKADGKPLELGRGAMGVTYKAFDVHLQRPVALKIINAQLFGNESARLRFVREARAAASVRHPNVASVFHIGESGGNHYYTMEFVDGESLTAFIRRSGFLETDLALEIVGQIAAGLAAIEKQHIVHRDIKPSNIMVSLQDGSLESVKIIDLGLAKGVAEENTLSTVGAFIGTPAYASPEQFAGIGTDIRSDLYSLGVTLWEMLSGKLPFSGSVAELMYQHQHAEPPVERLKSVPAPATALLQVLLAKDPNQRFQAPGQLQQALTKVRAAIDSGSRLTAEKLRFSVDRSTENLSKGKRRRQTFRWLLGSGLCFAVALIAWFFFVGHVGFLFNHRATEAVVPEKSIAVLPFESLSEKKSDAYFADGVQEEILNNLAKIAQLKVISRTSVMQYRGDEGHDLRQIANALGVANVLEGAVRREGNRVRVSTQLIDARSDKTIWADAYDRDLTDIFAIQSDISQTIANKLRAVLSVEERRRIDNRPTSDLAAYDLYLKAKGFIAISNINPLPTGNFQKPLLDALSLLDQAVELDPKFALAYCAAAEANWRLYSAYDTTPARRSLGDEAVAHALRLQPELPEAHLASARQLYLCYRDNDRARVQLEIAKRGLPNDSEALELEALMDRRQGNYEKAIQEFYAVIALDPRNPMTELANTLWMNRQFSAAARQFDRAIELAPEQPILKVLKPYFVTFMETGEIGAVQSALAALPASMAEQRDVLTWHLSLALYDRNWQQATQLVEKMKGGDDDGSVFFTFRPVPVDCYLILIERLREEHPDGDTNSRFAKAREDLNQKVQISGGQGLELSNLALIDAMLGKKEDAIIEAKHAVEMMPMSIDALHGPDVLLNLALVYSWTNELGLAFETLRPLTKIPNGIFYGDLKRDPLFDPLRKDPRFEKLLAALAPRE